MAIEIASFRVFEKNTLKGFLTIRLTTVGIEIRDICLHDKSGKRWLSMPAKPYTNREGAQSWSYILDFYDKDKGDQFQRIALDALDKYLRYNPNR